MSSQTAFLFDLDGALVDSVYQHVLAWREALTEEGIELSIWRIHRRIGMSGALLTNMLLRETGLAIEPERIERLQRLHSEADKRRLHEVRPLPGAADLLAFLTSAHIAWAVQRAAGWRQQVWPWKKPASTSATSRSLHGIRSDLRSLTPICSSRPGAYRVFDDPAHLLQHIDEPGARR